MYKSFYSLAQTPFSKDLRPSDAFPSSDYHGALSALKYLQQSKGIGLITGDPGAGKTFTLRTFKKSLNPSLYHVVYFPLSTGGVMDFYRGLVYGLGEEPKFRKVDLFRQIQQGIERMAGERKITPVFILDEMHMAKDAFLQDIAILFNFQMDSINPFILIMAGLPHLKTRLTLTHHRPLSQRVIAKFEIQPLSREEVAKYIDHHMKIAGAKMPIFTESAIEAIALRSQGWPRVINKLTINSLLFGSQLKKEQIDEEIVRLAIEDSSL
ncbi:ExeA family protein [Heyndrickxia sporothermodurans]|uniref:AAA family ATPase n=10 Tax=Heyndrickxia sporothermodurans TaxID=46224 RepID=A0AB37HPM1_9BACI|nr:AAA family ATPase [Heyndrickxia sporothermodurans]PTY86674.1 AAA family ATPase [Heyndrickxia sporothermodurans]QQX26883.1 AAA family ATPase [Heyndrickxia sporothermodurans]